MDVHDSRASFNSVGVMIRLNSSRTASITLLGMTEVVAMGPKVRRPRRDKKKMKRSEAQKRMKS